MHPSAATRPASRDNNASCIWLADAQEHCMYVCHHTCFSWGICVMLLMSLDHSKTYVPLAFVGWCALLKWKSQQKVSCIERRGAYFCKQECSSAAACTLYCYEYTCCTCAGDSSPHLSCVIALAPSGGRSWQQVDGWLSVNVPGIIWCPRTDRLGWLIIVCIMQFNLPPSTPHQHAWLVITAAAMLATINTHC